jgi:hypothetical protein
MGLFPLINYSFLIILMKEFHAGSSINQRLLDAQLVLFRLFLTSRLGLFLFILLVRIFVDPSATDQYIFLFRYFDIYLTGSNS